MYNREWKASEASGRDLNFKPENKPNISRPLPSLPASVVDPSPTDDNGCDFTPQSCCFKWLGMMYGFHIWLSDNGIQYLMPELEQPSL